MTQGIHYQAGDRIATLTIDRPSARNALEPDDWRALGAHVARAASDEAVAVLVITGAGDTFCAGGDLKTMPARLALPREERRAQLESAAQTIVALRQLDKPVLARIDGVAAGAGLALALACDVRIAAARARLGAPFHKIGLTGDFGILWLLPRLVGESCALDLLLSGELVDAARAERIGLVSRVVDSERLATETDGYARRLADGPPIAIAMTKRGVQLAGERTLAEMIAWEAAAQATCSRTADAAEGVRAFFEKRSPRFRGV